MTAYDTLCQQAREISLIGSMSSALSWDQETYMPVKALDHRARQLEWCAGATHRLLTGKKFRAALDAAEEGRHRLDSPEGANIREWRHEVTRALRIPTRLVEEESVATTRGKAAWAEARARSDFAAFALHLEHLLAIARRKADLWGFEDEPYDALLAGYERGARTREIAKVFSALRPELVSISREAVERAKSTPANLLRGKYPVEKQQTLNREIARSIGFDFEAGRIDTTTHPFCTTLGAGDVRLTTRYDEADFTSSLFGVLHEAGHGLYEQGLPLAEHGLPSGAAVSLGIHESQSRLWENHVGRSREFWERWLPRAAELFPHLRKLSVENFLRAINRAEFSFIRVEADEATYDLHILLRFSIERRMLDGALAVKDVPAAWNEEFRALFGVTPPDDARGCLQDIHWSMGGLGYFPTYTLGNLNAAQLMGAARKNKKIAQGLASAESAPLLEWLRAKVHRHGSVYLPQDLMRIATGRPTQAKWHLEHLRRRFL